MTHDLRIPKITTAMEVAILVRVLPDIEDCERLIREYGQMVAAGAKLDATLEANERMDALMRSSMGRIETPAEYSETMERVAIAVKDHPDLYD